MNANKTLMHITDKQQFRELFLSQIEMLLDEHLEGETSPVDFFFMMRLYHNVMALMQAILQEEIDGLGAALDKAMDAMSEAADDNEEGAIH